jgi:hypothetical protein
LFSGFLLREFQPYAASRQQLSSVLTLHLINGEAKMKERHDPEQSSQFNRTILIAITLAATLALLFIGLLYGCARSSRPERPSSRPVPSGRIAPSTQPRPFNIPEVRAT